MYQRETNIDVLKEIVPQLDFTEMCVVCILFVMAFLTAVFIFDGLGHGIMKAWGWWQTRNLKGLIGRKV